VLSSLGWVLASYGFHSSWGGFAISLYPVTVDLLIVHIRALEGCHVYVMRARLMFVD